MRRSIPALVATALLVAACSGDDDDTASSSSTTTTTTLVTDSTMPEPDPEPVDPTGTGLVCEVVGEPVAEADAVLDVRATDYSFTLAADEISGGDVFVGFVNNGDSPHELQIVQLPSADDLPLLADGRVDLDAIDEFEKLGPIGGGDSCEGTYQFDPGTYVLFSDLVTDAGDPYVGLGMVATFTVT